MYYTCPGFINKFVLTYFKFCIKNSNLINLKCVHFILFNKTMVTYIKRSNKTTLLLRAKSQKQLTKTSTDKRPNCTNNITQ